MSISLLPVEWSQAAQKINMVELKRQTTFTLELNSDKNTDYMEKS